jgi:uncharacterized glyoxalase superfamily protein PhnB
MSIKRVVPNTQSNQFAASEHFYTEVLGFEIAMQLGWITTFASRTNPSAQISIINQDPSGIHPDISVEVEDVDAVYTKAINEGNKIVYPLTDEPWGVRRFFVRDPNGKIINIVSHRA